MHDSIFLDLKVPFPLSVLKKALERKVKTKETEYLDFY